MILIHRTWASPQDMQYNHKQNDNVEVISFAFLFLAREHDAVHNCLESIIR